MFFLFCYNEAFVRSHTCYTAVSLYISCELIFELLKSAHYSGCSFLFQCIETLGNGCLTEEAMAELIRILDKIMKDHFSKAVARQEKRKDEDYDEVSIPALRSLKYVRNITEGWCLRNRKLKLCC
jgi:hypothetical protein